MSTRRQRIDEAIAELSRMYLSAAVQTALEELRLRRTELDAEEVAGS